MDEFKILLGAILDAKAEGDIKKQLKAIDDLAIRISKVNLDKSVIDDLKNKLTKNGIDINLVFGNANQMQSQAQKIGTEIGTTVSNSANKAMRSFSELKIGGGNIGAVFKDGLVDAQASLNKIKQFYSEFGQVKITNEVFDSDGGLQKFKVNIEQVNGDLKEMRSFMMELNGNSFAFPEDTIKGSESYVRHLNESKNIINATGEELNKQKQAIEQQNNYYKRILENNREIYSLKNKLVNAGEIETAEIRKQLKALQQRNSYNYEQLNKKGLTDDSYEKKVNDAKTLYENQLKLNQAKSEDKIISRELLDLQKQVKSIEMKFDNDSYGSTLEALKTKTRQWTDENGAARISTDELADSLVALQNASKAYTQDKSTSNMNNLVDAAKNFDNNVKKVNASIKNMNASLAKDSAVRSLNQRVQEFYDKNTASHQRWGRDLKQILSDTAQGAQLTDAQLDKLTADFNQIGNEARQAGKLGKSAFDGIKDQAKQFMQWTSVTSMVMKGWQTLKEMKDAVYDIDTAMTNLYKVTDETNAKYEQFLDYTKESAQELGRSVSSLVEQTANWAKLGFDIDEARELAKISSIYSNVGEVDDTTAVSDLVTAMKAFNIEASDSIKIVDALNALGNQYATDAKSLGEGLKNSASSLAAAGNDINETLALLTGGGEITQNVGELGNSLRVVSMRLRGMKGELQAIGEEYEDIESISKIQTQIYNLSQGKINIFKDDGSFKSTYQQLEEISKVINDLSDPDRANLIEIMFGKNRANQGIALLQAFQSGQVQKAYQTATESAGSAYEEQSKWMDSLEAKTQQFEAAFQSLSATIIDSDFLKGIVDFGTTSLNILDSLIDKFKIVNLLIGTMGSYFMGKTGLD